MRPTQLREPIGVVLNWDNLAGRIVILVKRLSVDWVFSETLPGPYHWNQGVLGSC